MVAALYVETGGVYFGLPNVDPWDEERDARLYEGPWPVVAHPPCARWSRLAGFTEARYGLKRGDDGGCFEAALDTVRRFGGVIEHPAYSKAWDAFNLPEPLVVAGWTGGLCGGFSAYVEQSRYGHSVKKATWLYAFGVELPDLAWGWTPDALFDSDFKWSARRHYTETGKPGLPHAERAKTPLAFRDVLLDMARSGAAATPTAPSRLATEGRALPYMGRRRWGQEMTPAR